MGRRASHQVSVLAPASLVQSTRDCCPAPMQQVPPGLVAERSADDLVKIAGSDRVRVAVLDQAHPEQLPGFPGWGQTTSLRKAAVAR